MVDGKDPAFSWSDPVKLENLIFKRTSDCLSFIFINLYEPFQRAVISFFNIVGEKASWQLPVTPVVNQTFTADPLALAGFPGAIASF